jgi:hypothetical protein
MNSFKPGDKVTWDLYGIAYTGTVKKIFKGNCFGLETGDLMVLPDKPHYVGQIVTVMPNRAKKVN